MPPRMQPVPLAAVRAARPAAGPMSLISTEVLLAAMAVSEREWQSHKQNKAPKDDVPRGCIPSSHAAIVPIWWQAEHGTVELKKLVIGCQLCLRTGIPVNATNYVRLAEMAATPVWVLCHSCEKGSDKTLEDQLTDLRSATLTSISMECKNPPCEGCRKPERASRIRAEFSWNDCWGV